LADAWERAEQVFALVRERFAGQERAAESTAEPAAKQDRAERLRRTFQSEAEPSAPNRREVLRAQFEQGKVAEVPPAEPGQDAEARRQALREAFAEKPGVSQTAAKKTPEQLRQAMQERDRPAVERRQDKDQGKDRGNEIER
jgi:hypothetical protein